jgi:V8-like Glu-specific endopeptidase
VQAEQLAARGVNGASDPSASDPGASDPGARTARSRRRRAGRGRVRHGRALVIRSAIITSVLAVVGGLCFAITPALGQPTRPASPRLAIGQSAAIGALFTTSGGQLASHFCSASVVNSPSGDLVLTAAHCVSGHLPSPIVFVPGYANGQAPFGIWAVTKVIVDEHWQSSADPDDDFAFLIVQRAGSSASVQSLTGAESVGIDEPAGEPVTVVGYPDGQDTPISCDNDTVAFSSTQLEFACDGYTDGTSGGPFLVNVIGSDSASMVIGVIGGYQQGGATPSVSYAARFGPSMAALYRTAMAEAGR